MGPGPADAWQPFTTYRMPMVPHSRLAGVGLRALEFARPNPLIRSISRGTPGPIPTNAEAEKQQKNLKKDLETTICFVDSRETLDTPSDTRTPTRGDQTIPEDTYF